MVASSWDFYSVNQGEKALADELAPLGVVLREKVRKTRAFMTGIHAPFQRKAAEDRRQQPDPAVAVVELFDQWAPTYLGSHGTQCVETLAYAPIILAPEVLVGPLQHTFGTHQRAAAFIRSLLAPEIWPIVSGQRRYRGETAHGPDVEARRHRYVRACNYLEGTPNREKTIVSSGPVPPFLGTWSRSYRGTLEDSRAVLFIGQDHHSYVSESIAAGVHAAGMLWVDSPRPSRARPLDHAWFGQRLDEAAVVVTAFSSVGYQAALAGKRVIYYTEFGGHRPVPLLDPARFPNTREASTREEFVSHLRCARTGSWKPLDAAIALHPDSHPVAILDRLDEALATWRQSMALG
jgi:hypothetical protein